VPISELGEFWEIRDWMPLVIIEFLDWRRLQTPLIIEEDVVASDMERDTAWIRLFLPPPILE
jgi:hypothetical protein